LFKPHKAFRELKMAYAKTWEFLEMANKLTPSANKAGGALIVSGGLLITFWRA
jgi:hypothetical protein